MKVRHQRASEEKIELQMTPMIDVVFQLLIFFIMSFKIVTIEGDFNIKMPLAAPSPGMPETPLPPLRVRLMNNPSGAPSIRLDNKAITDFGHLRAEIIQIVQGGGGAAALAEVEVELDCDYDLPYRYVVDAITAVTGYVKDNEIHKLIEKVKFAKPRSGPAGAE